MMRKLFNKPKRTFAIIGAMIAFFIIANIIKIVQTDDLTGYELQDYEDYLSELKDVPSDIEGMSQYDKYMMGLDYKDGSDSDYDGLSDKEEIEVYGTDPLKASSAGDLYTDSYKVQQGMDLFTYCDYTEEIVFAYNECEEVCLSADEPTDFYAVVEDYTDRYSLVDFGIEELYKGYWMYNYNGPVQIDLTKILASNEITLSDVHVWICQGDFITYGVSEFEKCNYTSEGNVITLDYAFDKDLAYFVYIAGDKSIFSSLLVEKGDSQINRASSIEEKDEEGMAIALQFPLIRFFSNNKSGTTLYYYSQNENFKEMIIAEYGSFSKLQEVDKGTVEHLVELFRTNLSSAEDKGNYDGIADVLPLMIFCYQIIEEDATDITLNADDSTIENGDEEERDVYRNYHTTFDPYVDELPFQNFESLYAPGGNCAGISHLTAYLFNTGSMPATGSYNNISWDLTTDEENTTLMDAGLYDYKERDFIDDNSGTSDNYIQTGLSDGEQEFVKMVGAYWTESNDKVKLNDYMMSNGESNDWSLAENMMEYLDNGKILCVGMLLADGTGHEVNVYDYYFNDSDELIFRVYDSNIPQNKRGNLVINCDGACYLLCKEIIRQDGTSSFAYFYWPIEGNYGYMASSNDSLMERHAIVVTDENWNVFN